MRSTLSEQVNQEMDHMDMLESQSIYILREAYRKFKKLAMLWSVGKDSTVLLWLARKAFFGHCPMPLVHIDTTLKIPEMIEFRDKIAQKWGVRLIVSTNTQALAEGMGPDKGRIVCCNSLKTDALQQLMAKEGFMALILGIRRDEEGTRAKERYFSPRDSNFEWNYKDQPPEFWDQFKTDFDEDTHIRVHPILHWTEVEVWQYIKRENIPVVDLYFARNGRRYRSLGCAPCTGTVESNATTVDQIIDELLTTTISERSVRAQDQEDTYAMQKLRARGYM